jgi:mannose-1-phosphate guanylyltransferase
MATGDLPLDLVVVIMAGGAGTRFWPLSTEARPKQFLRLFGERTLLQQSYDRVASLVLPERVLVLTNARFVPLVREQLPELPEGNVVGEPLRRDTAAAIALAALLSRERFGNPVMAVLTADHLIRPNEMFQRTLLSAVRAAAQSAHGLYTFGIVPTFPATGYGYLQRGERLFEDDGVPHYRLQAFREKPDAATAEAYLRSGEYFWNSGMFVWPVEAILEELARHLPDHLRHLGPAVSAWGTPQLPEALLRGFEPLVPISVDFGVMERAKSVRCVAASFEWDDVGGWLALERFLAHDLDQNAHRGQLRTHQAGSNLVFCEDEEEVVALVGVDGLVLVRAGKTTLVVRRERAEEIKKLVAKLEAELR